MSASTRKCDKSENLHFQVLSRDKCDELLKKCVDEHSFNYSVDIIIPRVDRVPRTISDVLTKQSYWVVKELPVAELINVNFVEAFVKRGKIYLLSDETKIDQHDCIALLPSGVLILHLTRETYYELGIQGRPSQYRGTDKFVVEINIADKDFRPGKKSYDRVKLCLESKCNLTLDYLVTWLPPDEEVCSSSLSSYLEGRGVQCKECSLTRTADVQRDVRVPKINSQKPENASVGKLEFLEWQGALALGFDMDQGKTDFTGLYTCPRPFEKLKQCLVCQCSGLVSTPIIWKLVQLLRDTMKKASLPWVCLSVAGFQDSPVSWGRMEHGFHHNGDNLYSCVLFENGFGWLYKVLGPNDRIS